MEDNLNLIGKETGLRDKNGEDILFGSVVHWSDGGDDLSIDERMATRWDRIAVVCYGLNRVDVKFKVIDSQSESVKNHDMVFCYGNFYYKDTEKFLTVLASSPDEYRENFKSVRDVLFYVS